MHWSSWLLRIERFMTAASMMIVFVLLIVSGCSGRESPDGDAKTTSGKVIANGRGANSTAAGVRHPASSEKNRRIDSATAQATDTKSTEKKSKDGSLRGDTVRKNLSERNENAGSPLSAESVPAKSDAGADSTGDTAGVGNATGTSSAASPAESDERFGSVRLLLLADAAPLVLELQITLDGRSHDAVFDRFIQHVREIADADRDGEPLWEEVVASPLFRYGQLGNMRLESDDQRRSVIRRYDYNRDGKMDVNEIPAFLSNGQNVNRSFILAPQDRALRSDGGARSVLFTLLDEDNNGELDKAELTTAGQRLRTFDANDDRTLTMADVAPNDSPEMRMRTVGQRYGRDLVLMLNDDVQWGVVLVNLEREYAFGGSLAADSFAWTPKTYEALDEDDDGQISAAEITGLATIPPHVRIGLDWGAASPSTDKGGTLAPRIKLLGFSDELRDQKGVGHQQTGGRITLMLRDQHLALSATDSVQLRNGTQTVSRLLEQFDKDDNGYLDSEEVNGPLPGFGVPLAAADFDADGKVYALELKRFVEQQQLVQGCRIIAQASSRENPLYAILDANSDSRISERELANIQARISQFDRDGDKRLSRSELPNYYQLTFARGAGANAAMAVMPSNTRTPETLETAGPGWFTAMDQNQDGEVSRIEFLGNDDHFGGLDANQDGFISLIEAKTFATSGSAKPK